MASARELLEMLQKTENLVGSASSLKLYRQIFEGEDWKNFVFLEALELAWQRYAALVDEPEDLYESRGIEGRDALYLFMRNVQGGFLPPPEALLPIAEAFERYLNANGQLSLDEAFFGKPHKRNSSYAIAWGSTYQLMERVEFFFALGGVGKDQNSQIRALEIAWDPFFRDYEFDPETLLRTWRRWLKLSHDWED